MGPARLLRLRESGCILSSSRNVHVFDKPRLQAAVAKLRGGVTTYELAKHLGTPNHAISAMIAAGLINEINDPDVHAMARKTLIDPNSLRELNLAFGRLPKIQCTDNLISLSEALAADLSPFPWVDALKAIKSGELSAFVFKGSEGWAQKLFLCASDLQAWLEPSRLRQLPSETISASVAGPIIGFSDVFLGFAIKSGFLKRDETGISLEELDKFRRAFIDPREISTWFDGSGAMFAKAMMFHGIKPAARLDKNILWRRADVDWYRSQPERNMRSDESGSAE